LGNLASHYGVASGAGWGLGDFDGDGDVDLSDLSSLATHYDGGSAQAMADFQVLVVPEPATLSILLMVGGFILSYHRGLTHKKG
jgi:hypothetical protein